MRCVLTRAEGVHHRRSLHHARSAHHVPQGTHHAKKTLLPGRQKSLFCWRERGDLPAFFRREDAAFDGSWLRAKKSRYSPVCALVHAQPTGLCGHDSSLPDTKKKNPNIHTVSFEVHPL